MHTNHRRSIITGLALAFAVILTGCATADPDPGITGGAPAAESSGTLDQLIADGLANAKSDFQRQVLEKAQETGQISEADWKEANNQHKECMAAKGYTIEIIYQGSRALVQGEADNTGSVDEQKAAGERSQQANTECYEKTAAFINEIYAYLNGGQESGGMDGDTVQRAVLACLIDRGLAPDNTSYDEFLADLEQNGGKQFAPNGQKNEAEIAKCWMENTQ